MVRVRVRLRVRVRVRASLLVELLLVGVGVGVAHTPAVLVADHRPVLPRDGVVGAQVAQCVVRIVVVVPMLVAVVPAPAIVEPPARGVPSGRRAFVQSPWRLCGAGVVAIASVEAARPRVRHPSLPLVITPVRTGRPPRVEGRQLLVIAGAGAAQSPPVRPRRRRRWRHGRTALR
eukprot:scaffold106388_cov57-Phaeocystis_antarctica.AAC.4